jgi:23S rRNA (cytosine1962-C5)-methyltransferase
MKLLSTKPSAGYELIDSGDGEKLERFGSVTLRRPDPQALWAKTQSKEIWASADAEFVSSGKSGSWKKRVSDSEPEIPETWQVEVSGLKFALSLSVFKHVGIFPEQAENWNWIQETISLAKDSRAENSIAKEKIAEPVTVLNLFGYTGGATLAAAKAGAEVCHVDGSKVSVAKAGENAKLSGLENKPIRWIIDDVMEFVKRENRRGKKYDAIIMDPPAYGHGPKKELWKIEKDLPELMKECKKILSNRPLFLLLNGYASGYSAIAYKNNLEELVAGISQRVQSENPADSLNTKIEFGELALESVDKKLLPAGIFARWRFVE